MFGKKKKEDFETVITEPVEEAPVFVPSKLTTIGKDVVFEGDFVTNDSMDIFGTVKGSIYSKSQIHVAGSGFLNGDAKANDITIDGMVDGTAVIDNLTSISGSGTMTGSLKTGKLLVDPKAYFDGRLSMTSGRQAAAEEASAEDATPIEGFEAGE